MDLDDIDKDHSRVIPKNINDISRLDKSINLKENYSSKIFNLLSTQIIN